MYVTSSPLRRASVELVELPGRGRGLVALRDVAPGERLLSERPLLKRRAAH